MPPRLTIEEVKETIEKEGCKLVSTEYSTNKKPINVLCSCASKNFIIPNKAWCYAPFVRYL